MRNVIIGIFIPLLGTTIGASMVFFIKNEMKVRFRKMLLGFASGVMMAASANRSFDYIYKRCEERLR